MRVDWNGTQAGDVLARYVTNKNIWFCRSDVGLTLPQLLPGGGDSITTLRVKPTMFDKFGSSYKYTTELGLLHIQYSASGYYARNSQEVSASLVRVAEDMSASWHGGGDEFLLNAVFAEGHAATLNSDQFDATAGVVTSPPPAVPSP